MSLKATSPRYWYPSLEDHSSNSSNGKREHIWNSSQDKAQTEHKDENPTGSTYTLRPSASCRQSGRSQEGRQHGPSEAWKLHEVPPLRTERGWVGPWRHPSGPLTAHAKGTRSSALSVSCLFSQFPSDSQTWALSPPSFPNPSLPGKAPVQSLPRRFLKRTSNVYWARLCWTVLPTCGVREEGHPGIAVFPAGEVK